MLAEFNINGYVYVKLTDAGRKEIRRRTEELEDYYNKPRGTFSDHKEEDADGWSKWQMHELMNTFGEMTTVGSELPFETTIRLEAVK